MTAAESPIERLLPDSGPTSIAAEVRNYDPVARAGDERPFVAMNFAATLDGRAAIEGRSGPIGTEVDLALLLRLRTCFDAVMVGAGTLRAERYGRLLKDPELRGERERRGLSADPLAVILSGTLDLPWDAPLFTCGEGQILIMTVSERDAPECATATEVVRFQGDKVPIADALGHLRSEHGVRALLSEGGPTVHGQFQAAAVVDELFLTLSPRMSGGHEPPILKGELPQIREARLMSLLRSESELMARYTFAT